MRALIVDDEAAAGEALIDYLTKPVGADRFDTGGKARDRDGAAVGSTPNEKVAAALQEAIETHSTRTYPPARLIGERSNRLYFIQVDNVDYLEAYGNYVRIHVGDQEYVRRDTLKRLACELRGTGFEWVHRSTLLNLRRVAFRGMISPVA